MLRTLDNIDKEQSVCIGGACISLKLVNHNSLQAEVICIDILSHVRLVAAVFGVGVSVGVGVSSNKNSCCSFRRRRRRKLQQPNEHDLLLL